jgi:hypothetical protein
MGLDDKIKNAAQDIAGKGKKDQAAASAKQTGEDVKDVFRG